MVIMIVIQINIDASYYSDLEFRQLFGNNVNINTPNVESHMQGNVIVILIQVYILAVVK